MTKWKVLIKIIEKDDVGDGVGDGGSGYYIYPINIDANPTMLLHKLDLMIASRRAGNTDKKMKNEINHILNILHLKNIIDKNQYSYYRELAKCIPIKYT